MIKIPRMSDRFRLKVDGVTFMIAPLSQEQRLEISKCGNIDKGEYVQSIARMQSLYMKYGLKEVKGLHGFDKKPYSLEFDGDHLTDDSVSEIQYLPMYQKMVNSALQLLSGVPGKILDDDGKPLKGVKLDIVSKNEGPL